MVPHSSPLKKRRIVSQAPLQAAPAAERQQHGDRPPAPRPMSRETSGSSHAPSRRTGACGTIRRASQTLTSTGTSIAAKPMANRRDLRPEPRLRGRRVGPSASYHMTSVMRLTAPPSRPRTMMADDDPAADDTHRRHGHVAPEDRPRDRRPATMAVPAIAPATATARRPSSIGVTLRSIGGRAALACAHPPPAWRRWSSSSSLSNHPDIRAARTSGGSRR